MNEHKKMNELLVDFVLGELSQQQALEVRIHLTKCSRCRSELNRLEALLECTERIRKSSVDEQVCESAKHAILQNVERERIKRQISGTNVNLEYIKKRIIKSPITKITTAAVIIIAAILILQNGSVNITSTAFGLDDVITALRKAQWMHVKYEIKELPETNIPEEIIRPPETWISVNPHRVVQIFGNGNISFREGESGIETAYDLKSNKITVTYYSKVSDVRPSSIESLLFDQISGIEKRGGIVTYSDDLLQDKPVTVINVDTTNVSESGLSLSLIVDPQTCLPIKFTLRSVDGQSVIASGIIDYPEKGPFDIYELGAPQDAEVVVIDKRDQPELIEALKPYNKARKNLVSDYILISTYERDSLIQTINVTYNQGRKQRHERHSVRIPPVSKSNDLTAYKKALGDSFESLLIWTREIRGRSLDIRIYDGEYYYRAEKDVLDNWKIEDKKYWPDRNPIALEDLSDWGWPEIPPKSCVKQIENDYSRENNLIAFEVTTESDIRNGKIFFTAQKTINYLDQSRDYMCVRREMFYHPLSGGLGDTKIKDVDFDPNEIPDEPNFVRFVSEFGQTESGQWYPKKVETHSKSWDADEPLSLSSINTLYLKTNPEFPEGIFDPNNLPKKEG
jgi:hypothetical protein